MPACGGQLMTLRWWRSGDGAQVVALRWWRSGGGAQVAEHTKEPWYKSSRVGS